MFRNISLLKNKLAAAKRIVCSYSQVVTKQVAPPETSDASTFVVGEKIHGFSVKNIQQISEFNVTAICLSHDKTNAEYLHLFRNDSNNVFSINFRTTPLNSTGLPHILEHIVLCGSEMYPVRDPFFKMLNRSLASFMNAMTSSDFTMYPFSTPNYSDYRNLQKIYLDAVFRPNLREVDFMQEGWRLENTDPSNINSELTIKGVVFNEMKGVFSENESILQQKLQNLLLPDHTYGVCSGGDPLIIPDLTLQALRDFHRNHYHPSNSRFYSYGNFPLVPTLEYLNNNYLSKYDSQDTHGTEVPLQKRWQDIKKQHITGRFEQMGESLEQQNSIVISYAMTDVTNVYETFLLQFVSELLIKGSNSPFYKSLIEPNISGGFSPSTGFDTHARDTVFSLGLQNLKADDLQKVEKLFDQTIDDVVSKGFEEKHVESVLDSYELSLKHEGSNFGLNLLYMILPSWNHGGNVIDLLRFNSHIGKLRHDISNDPKFLQNIVKTYFKDNKHKLILTMSPDKDYDSKQAAAEKAILKNKTASLTPEVKKEIHQKCLELIESQKAPQNVDILPSLGINDISNDVEKVPKEKLRIGAVPTQVFSVDTNGITYFRGVLNTSQLSPEQQMLLPLFCYIINKLGTDEMNYRDFDSLVQQKTSGLNLQVHIGDSLYQLHSYEPGLLLSSYCLNKNVDYMWDLWSQIFNLSELKDVSRFEMLVKMYMANVTHGIADSGHTYAMTAAQGLVSGVAYQKDLLLGLQHISYMKRLVKTASFVPMLNELSKIAKILFDKNNLRASVNIQESSKVPILTAFEKFISKIPGNTLNVTAGQMYTSTEVWAPTDAINCHHHVLNVPVNYCSEGILTVPYTHSDFSKLQVLAKLCSAKYLHPEIREKHGAYGSGARLSTDGVFTFYSYRDPRNTATLDTFDNTYSWMEENFDKIDTQDILEAKLGVFQAIDAPIPPGAKGSQDFLYGLTSDVLQRHRAAVIAVNKDGIKSVLEKYLTKIVPSKVGKVILGAKDINKANRIDELWTVIDSE